MSHARVRIFDGALEHLFTHCDRWESGHLKARFIHDQAFDRTSAVADYTGKLGDDVHVCNPSFTCNESSNILGLDCDDIQSNVSVDSAHQVDAVIIYKCGDTDIPLFYLPFDNVCIAEGDDALYEVDCEGLVQWGGSPPRIVKKWFEGCRDLTAFPESLQVFTCDTAPCSAVMSDLTSTSNILTIGTSISLESDPWAGGTFQVKMKTSTFKLTVQAGFMHSLVIGSTDTDSIWATIPLLRNIEDSEKIIFTSASHGFTCIGGY